MGAGNLTIAVNNTPSGGTLTAIGGAGTPQNPMEWRIVNTNPLFAQDRLLSSLRRVNDVDQIDLTLTCPYSVTDTTTGVISAIARAEVHMKFNFPRSLPQSIVDRAVNIAATVVSNYDAAAINLRDSLEARQSGA